MFPCTISGLDPTLRRILNEGNLTLNVIIKQRETLNQETLNGGSTAYLSLSLSLVKLILKRIYFVLTAYIILFAALLFESFLELHISLSNTFSNTLNSVLPSQNTASGTYHESAESSPHFHTLFLSNLF
jgi:hypothetical protein